MSKVTKAGCDAALFFLQDYVWSYTKKKYPVVQIEQVRAYIAHLEAEVERLSKPKGYDVPYTPQGGPR